MHQTANGAESALVVVGLASVLQTVLDASDCTNRIFTNCAFAIKRANSSSRVAKPTDGRTLG